ncbi:GntR family transcriptional regulator [Plantactinospora sonchi]|uniref:GntR family transcriptional regulator n=1 Tax=Plantactinospora sonchi TaxID=1544735 RepID=A0ABU7S4H9_9ACTN
MPADPPYRRIVADLRRRIATGELAPGDRVPSTRQIATEWGVALATATRALSTLREQGVVRARPRVGTVVAEAPAAPTPPRSARQPTRHTTRQPTRQPTERPGADRSDAAQPGREPELGPSGRRPAARVSARPEADVNRDRIVRAAIEIADAEGLDALSMRAVASRLGVSTMSPYRYVGSKDDLVRLMADTAYGEQYPPESTPAGWRSQLELGARVLWELHRRHPWLAHTGPLSRPLPLPNLLVHSERMLSALDALGLDPTTMLDVTVLIYNHVQGLAVHLEREAQARAATGLSDEQWIDTQAPAMDALATAGPYPTYARILGSFRRTGYDLDLTRLFELGLHALLDGLAVRLGQRTGAGPR